MAEIVTCPKCDRKLRVPDEMLGKKVKCPGCETMFVGGAEEVEPEEVAPAPKGRSGQHVVGKAGKGSGKSDFDFDDEDEDRPRGKSRRDDDDGDDRIRKRRDEDDAPPAKSGGGGSWRTVSTGMNLIMLGWIIWIGAGVYDNLGGWILAQILKEGKPVDGFPGGFPGGDLGRMFDDLEKLAGGKIPGMPSLPPGVFVGSGVMGFFLYFSTLACFAGWVCLLLGHAASIAIPDAKSSGTLARGLAIASLALWATVPFSFPAHATGFSVQGNLHLIAAMFLFALCLANMGPAAKQHDLSGTAKAVAFAIGGLFAAHFLFQLLFIVCNTAKMTGTWPYQVAYWVQIILALLVLIGYVLVIFLGRQAVQRAR